MFKVVQLYASGSGIKVSIPSGYKFISFIPGKIHGETQILVKRKFMGLF